MPHRANPASVLPLALCPAAPWAHPRLPPPISPEGKSCRNRQGPPCRLPGPCRPCLGRGGRKGGGGRIDLATAPRPGGSLRGTFAHCVKLLFSFYRSGRIETSSEDEAGSVPSDVGLVRLESVCSVLSLGVGSGRPRTGLDCSHLYVLCSLFLPR